MIEEVHLLLQRWGDWRAQPVRGLSFPNTTTLYRFHTEGVVVSTGSGPSTPTFRIDHRAARIDRDISELPRQPKAIILLRYLHQQKEADIAAALKVSDSTLRRRMDDIHYYFAGKWNIPFRD